MNRTTCIGENVMVAGVVGKKADTLNVVYDPTGENKPGFSAPNQTARFGRASLKLSVCDIAWTSKLRMNRFLQK